MRRSLGIFLIVGLVLVPAASAKGPHVVLSSGDERVKPGRPWHATVELMEYGRRVPRPVLIGRKGERRVAARGARAGGMYGFRVVFPAAGRWRLTLVEGKRRFVFPAVSVGTGYAPPNYVAFPEGSMAERQGGGGVWHDEAEPAGSGRDTPLPPETVTLAQPAGDGGFPFWILPAAGVALLGGIATVRARK